MKYYMGMDHWTTAISFEIIDENKEEVSYFKLNRDKLSKKEIFFKDIINDKIDIKKVK